MATARFTYLEAVNAMLRLLPAAPVASLTDAKNQDLAVALGTLEEVDRKVQSTSWHWNTTSEKAVTADSAGRFPVEANWVQFDLPRGIRTDVDITIRGGFLFDRKAGSNTFGTAGEVLTGRLVERLTWDDLPSIAQNYILTLAGFQLVATSLPDQTRAGFTDLDVTRSRRALRKFEAQQSDACTLRDDPMIAEVTQRRGGLRHY